MVLPFLKKKYLSQVRIEPLISWLQGEHANHSATVASYERELKVMFITLCKKPWYVGTFLLRSSCIVPSDRACLGLPKTVVGIFGIAK